MERLYVATSNAGKLRELHRLFDAAEFELLTLAAYVSPAEGETSYADNAALKARALHAQLADAGNPQAVLADDSGLEVDALGRRPGVLTADYGGAGATWPERRAQLLHEVAATGDANRRARFVCVLHYIGADKREFSTFATVDGEIAPAERGPLGFSFDPIFLHAPTGRTFAELSEEVKNRLSHRGIAAAALIAALQAARRDAQLARFGA